MQIETVERPPGEVTVYIQNIDLQNGDYVTTLYIFRIILNELSIVRLLMSKEGFFLDENEKRIKLNENKSTNTTKKRIR